MEAETIAALVAAIIGAGGGGGSVVAMKVNIAWMKQAIEKNEKALERAHSRIDALERRLANRGGACPTIEK